MRYVQDYPYFDLGPIRPGQLQRNGMGLALLFLGLVGACATMPAPPTSDPSRADLLEQIEGWALGTTERWVETARADAAVFITQPQNPDAPLQPVIACGPVQSMLVSPRKNEIYVLIDGELHLQSVANRNRRTRLASVPADVSLIELLYLGKAPGPPVIFATVRRTGASHRDLWQFVIEDGRAVGSRVSDLSAHRDQQALFQNHWVPRCRTDGTDCLLPTVRNQTSALDVEQRPGHSRTRLREFSDLQLYQAAWNPGHPNSVYLLAACPKKA